MPPRPRGHVGLVRDHHDGDAGAVGLVEQVHDLLEVLLSSAPGRLVGEDQARLADQRARDGHALLLAARHLGGQVVGPRRAGPTRSRDSSARRLRARARDALVVERQRDVLERRLERQQVERLEHEADEAVAVDRAALRSDRSRISVSPSQYSPES